ncbi:hypothetical protein [Herbaspirillum sp.]|uniref:hypothetical protein n=1 Tax=Herbaspirillum sp. TaxID=1890675 RepID=UPI001B1361B2|nr:hypothetical protein [Herbaspirillum sp.]MBO9538744.1 hypothetical protein [Herbaspirillum sp.]
MKHLLKNILFLLSVIPAMTLAAPPTQTKFLKSYSSASQEMTPELQTTSCTSKPIVKVPGKTITECRLNVGNSLLTIDSMNNQVTGVWLMLDSQKLNPSSDLIRTGGMLIRAMRGSYYGDYLAVSASVFSASSKKKWKEVCTDDKDSSSRVCVSSDDGNIFNMTLTPNL